MISHVHIGVRDFERAFAFYRPMMELLGNPLKFAEKEWAGWKPGAPAEPGNGQMIALLAPSRDVVERCYQAALSQGAQSEGAPGLRPHYHPHYFGAYFRDPDGNKICVCCHDPVGANRQVEMTKGT